MATRVTITGAGGNAGEAVSRVVAAAGYAVRMADVMPPPPDVMALGEFVRCDTRTVTDVQAAVAGADAVIHLAAWHSAHRPPVSDATIFAVNVDGTFNVLEACRAAGIGSLVFASSMAYGWGSVYSVTKVLGEELCRSFREMTGASVAMLRYHEFIPRPYLEFGAKLLRNAVDRSDIAGATLAALRATVAHEVNLFRTIVHSNHAMPAEVIADFRNRGPAWVESQVRGGSALMAKYGIDLPEQVEQHDLSAAASAIGWQPRVNVLDFVRDLAARDARSEDIASLWTPSTLEVVAPRIG